MNNEHAMKKKIKTILISQPKPITEKSPYFDLAKNMKVTVDFRPFIHVEAIEVKEFRKQTGCALRTRRRPTPRQSPPGEGRRGEKGGPD